jgi:uncharacterized damage-inducible protein DinB
MTPIRLLPALAICAFSLCAAEPELSPVARSFDSQLNGIEREVVSLVEAMPADKFTFAPKNGEFAGVRTFAQQATHIAAVNFQISAALLGEANPVQMGKQENGPADLKTKEQIVDFVKRSFAYTHKALATLTSENLMGQVQSPFGKNKIPRLTVATMPQWHSFDHYGQMAVYARMCGMVPPASRPRNQ